MSETSTVEAAIADKVHDLPASTPSEAEEEHPKHNIKKRLFNRERSLHDIFGGGKGKCLIIWFIFLLKLFEISFHFSKM